MSGETHKESLTLESSIALFYEKLERYYGGRILLMRSPLVWKCPLASLLTAASCSRIPNLHYHYRFSGLKVSCRAASTFRDCRISLCPPILTWLLKDPWRIDGSTNPLWKVGKVFTHDQNEETVCKFHSEDSSIKFTTTVAPIILLARHMWSKVKATASEGRLAKPL